MLMIDATLRKITEAFRDWGRDCAASLCRNDGHAREID